MADTMVDIYNDYMDGVPSSTIVERLQNIPVEDIPQVRYDADGEFYEGGNSCLLYTSPSPRDRG